MNPIIFLKDLRDVRDRNEKKNENNKHRYQIYRFENACDNGIFERIAICCKCKSTAHHFSFISFAFHLTK